MVIAVDFDGTIVEHAYPKIGKPIPFALETLKKLQREGHRLILWTMREGDLLKEAIEYCEKNGLECFAYNKNYPDEVMGEGDSRKLSVDLFIDDRNIGGLPDWGIIYQIIHSGTNSFNGLEKVNNKKRKKNFLIQMGEAWAKARGHSY